MKTRNKQQEKPDLQIRAGEIEVRAAKDEGGAPSIRMSVSSEEPVLTTAYVNDRWQRVYEVLDHSESGVDLTRCKDGLVILDRHYGDQIGLMNVELRDGKIGGTVEFCSGGRAQEIGQDAAKGLRRNVSVGYVVNPDNYRIEGERDGIPVVRATRWMPYEASFEPVPADTTVGVNRAEKITPAVKVQPETNKQRKNIMEPKDIAKLFSRAAKFGIDTDQVEAIDLTDAVAARAALDALIVDKQAADLVAERKTVVELKERKPDAMVTGKTVDPIGGDVEAEKKAVRKFNVMNVVRSMAGMKVDTGYEREISEECAKLRGKPAEGIIIPFGALAQRDFTVSGTSSASVATDLHSDQFIDLLRTNYTLGQAGVQFLTGLVGDVAIPKMSAGASGYWVSEGSDITESEPTLGQVTGTPHTCGALVDISRKLMIQSTPDAEAMVRNEIVNRVMRTVQIAVFAGTGADGQPSAITNASGINNPSVTAGTPTYAEMLSFIGNILTDNAAADNQKWIGTGEVWEKLAGTKKDAGSGDFVLNPDNNIMLGRDFLTTEDVGANSLFFGNWASVVVGIWGNGIDVAATDSKLFASGGMTMRALQDVDVMVRLGQSLAYNAAVTS